MKAMPYTLKQKLRQYDKAIRKANSIHIDIMVELDRYNVPYDYLVANGEMYSEHPQTEALAYISNAEGEIEESIKEIEEVFLYFVNRYNK
ncbi:hypothetical protein [Bacillus sp. Hm123]|uniref:hypothetical protein n=1 Tax=Bacillus sp. Hm123 TaxID=3450745 RepID=UPI003F41C7A9